MNATWSTRTAVPTHKHLDAGSQQLGLHGKRRDVILLSWGIMQFDYFIQNAKLCSKIGKGALLVNWLAENEVCLLLTVHISLTKHWAEVKFSFLKLQKKSVWNSHLGNGNKLWYRWAHVRVLSVNFWRFREEHAMVVSHLHPMEAHNNSIMCLYYHHAQWLSSFCIT